MSELEVRIVPLEPIHVASLHGFGESPENEAWAKLMAWAGPRGLLESPRRRRIFGFNNPDPSPGSPSYGYEFWIEVDPGTKAEGEATIKEFPGGLYAVTRCLGVLNISKTWHRLAAWCENGPYGLGRHQWLEEHLSPAQAPADEQGLLLDLYCPITEQDLVSNGPS